MKKGDKSGVTRSEASGEHALLPASPPPALQVPGFWPLFGVLPHFWSFLQEEKGPGSRALGGHGRRCLGQMRPMQLPSGEL